MYCLFTRLQMPEEMANNTTLITNSSNLAASCSVSSTSTMESASKAASYFVVIFVSIVGNSLIIRVVTKTRRMRTAINRLIVNMAASDLLTTMVTMVIETYVYITQALSKSSTWFGGVEGIILCKIIIFVQGIAISSSVLTLVAIALNRFVAVLFPFRSSQFQNLSTVAIVVIWVVSCILVSPILYAAKVVEMEGSPYCVEEWSPLFDNKTASEQYTLVLFGLLYAFPLVLISVLYSCVVYKVWVRQVPGNVTAPNQQLELQTKKRVLKMLITVVVVFTLCWLPYHVYLLLAFFVHNGECPISPQYIFFGLLLGHTNSAINPCIYVIFNRDFRQGFLEFLRTCSSCCRGNNTDVRMESNSQCATFRDTAMQPLNLNSAQYPLSLITDQLVRRGSCSSRALLTPPIVHRAPSLGDAEEIVAV